MNKYQCYTCDYVSMRGEPRCKCNKIHNPKGGSNYTPCIDIEGDKCNYVRVIPDLPSEVKNFFDYLDSRLERGVLSEYTVYNFKLSIRKCLIVGMTVKDIIQADSDEIIKNVGNSCFTAKCPMNHSIRSFRQFLEVV